MCLDRLAQHLVDLSRDQCTPTLVVPASVEVRGPFLIDLASEIAKLDARSLRFDWLISIRGSWGSIQTRAALWRAKRMDAKLTCCATPSRLQVTAALSRPEQSGRLVIGLCDDQWKLPKWSGAVQLNFSVQ